MSTFIGAVTRLSRRQAAFTNATNAFDTQFASPVVAVTAAAAANASDSTKMRTHPTR
jgi:hypothetical protein